MGKFTPNHRKLGGRAKGTLNRSTVAGREFAAQLVNDPTYRENLRERLLAGKVPPGVETMLWSYAIGRPKQEIELSGSIGNGRDVATMTDAELLAELEAHHDATAAFLTEHLGQRHTQGD